MTTNAEYLKGLTTALAIPSGTYNAGLKILWGEKVESLGAAGINASTPQDILKALLAFAPGGTIMEKEMAWLAARGAPAALTTLADRRSYCVNNALMP